MNKFTKAIFVGFAFSALAASCGRAYSQTTTTLGGIRTGTNGNVTQTTTFSHLNITGSDYRVPMSELAKAVLSNLTISSGGASILTLTGINATPTTTLGVLTLTQTTTGVLTLSSLIINSTGATGWTQSLLQVIPTTTSAVVTANLTGTGGILFGRNSGGGSSISTSSGITGTNLPAGLTYGITSTDTNIYLKSESGRSVFLLDGSLGYVASFGNSTGFVFMSGAGSNLSGLYSSTASYLKATVGSTGSLGTFYTGGFGVGYRALTTSSALTITDGSVSGSGAITVTLPDATTLTGRMVIVPNIGAVTLTVSGLTSTQAINAAQAIGVVSGSTFIGISTGTTWIGQRVSQ